MLPMARSSGSALPAFTVGAFNGGDLLRVRCDLAAPLERTHQRQQQSRNHC